MDEVTIQKLRGAIGDRALWLAFLFESFAEALPAEEVERLSRKAIRAYGRYKASKDPEPFGATELVRAFVASGAAELFDSEIAWGPEGAVNRVRRCALVDAWRQLGLPPERIDLLCDIAMEGDRGRAEAHGIGMSLDETIGKGDAFCRIGLGPG